MIKIALGALLALTTCHGWAASPCRALDGDTIVCGREHIRLRDVYAAESGQRGSVNARANLQRKLDSGQVRITRHGKDHYGRTLGDVYVGGRRVTQSDIGPKAGRGTQPGTAFSPKAPRSSGYGSAHRPPRAGSYGRSMGKSTAPRGASTSRTAPSRRTSGPRSGSERH